MRVSLLVLSLVLSGCTSQLSEQREGYLAEYTYQASSVRPRIKMVVIHYTAENLPSSLMLLTGRDVSAHYLISPQPPVKKKQPIVWQLVPETLSASHAGVSSWRKAIHLNDTSLGIELVNPGFSVVGTEHIWYSYPPEQIAALAVLLHDLVRRYGIAPENIVGHSDIAPLRKQDPGPLFPWRQLAQQGLGAWPDAARVNYWLQGRQPSATVPVKILLQKLASYGYGVTLSMDAAQQQKVIAAFQMHFRPSDYRGLPDAETSAIAEALLEKCGGL